MAEEEKKEVETKEEEKTSEETTEQEELSPEEMTSEELEEAEDKILNPPEEEEETDAEKEEKKSEEETKEEEEDVRYDNQGNLITGDPLKDTQAALGREREARKVAERKLEDEKHRGFERLPQEDQDQLDEDELVVYKENEKTDDTHRQKMLDEDIKDGYETNRDAVIMFMAKEMGLDHNNPKDVTTIADLMKNPEAEETKMMLKLDQYLTTNIRPVRVIKVDDSGLKDVPVYSAEQLKIAHNVVFHDKIVSDTAKKAKEDTIKQIEDASDGGSVFDKTGKSGNERSNARQMKDYSQDEIAGMNEAETDALLAENG